MAHTAYRRNKEKKRKELCSWKSYQCQFAKRQTTRVPWECLRGFLNHCQSLTFQTMLATTLGRKVLCGYQAWFNAEGDGSPQSVGWRHWFHSETALASFDLWPDTSEFDDDELFPTPLRMADGSPARLYSGSNLATVSRHFLWMQQYGIDGVFLQRFVNELTVPELLTVRNKVLESVKSAASKHGRVFCIMYDVSGAAASSVLQTIRQDWDALNADSLTSSRGYLHHGGKPVVGIWGFGFVDRPDPGADSVLELIHHLQRHAFVVGGTPSCWRQGGGDALPGYGLVFNSFDCVCPWSVGRFASLSACDEYYEGRAAEDARLCRAQGRAYAPVVWPGFSEGNLQNADSRNCIPRHGGLFLGRQARHAISLQPLFVFVASTLLFLSWDSLCVVCPL